MDELSFVLPPRHFPVNVSIMRKFIGKHNIVAGWLWHCPIMVIMKRGPVIRSMCAFWWRRLCGVGVGVSTIGHLLVANLSFIQMAKQKPQNETALRWNVNISDNLIHSTANAEQRLNEWGSLQHYTICATCNAQFLNVITITFTLLRQQKIITTISHNLPS